MQHCLNDVRLANLTGINLPVTAFCISALAPLVCPGNSWIVIPFSSPLALISTPLLLFSLTTTSSKYTATASYFLFLKWLQFVQKLYNYLQNFPILLIINPSAFPLQTILSDSMITLPCLMAMSSFPMQFDTVRPLLDKVPATICISLSTSCPGQLVHVFVLSPAPVIGLALATQWLIPKQGLNFCQ